MIFDKCSYVLVKQNLLYIGQTMDDRYLSKISGGCLLREVYIG
jgi:hypothetical protein